MIKDIIKNQKGVSLVSLAVAIVILVIITNVLIYNAQDGVQVKILTNLYNDVDNLKDKVSEYYTKYGTIPVNKTAKYDKESSVAIEKLKQAGILSNAVDSGEFYVIELSSLENLTLTYGEDYNKMPSSPTQEELNALTDIYIINSVSQNIFYVAGVNVDNKMYYTNYTSSEVDNAAAKIRFYDGVKILDGCSYLSGTKTNELKIKKDNSNPTVTYTWVPAEKGLTEVPEKVTDITGSDNTKNNVEQFLNSVDTYGGYWKKTDTEIEYIAVNDDNKYWSEKYDENGIYTDTNGDSAYIPKGFKVSTKQGLNKINNGLVVKDENNNEYVWISVPKSVTIDCGPPDEIEDALKKYVADYRVDGYEDVWYDGCGIAKKEEYDDLKQRMLESIQEKGGFYIGRYEAGLEGDSPKTGGLASSTLDSVVKSNGLPVSEQDKYVYNYVTCAQAQGLANELNIDNYDTSLMFGIQWDLVCKFIQETGAKTKSEISSDSKDWGNYQNSEFNLLLGKYSLNGTGTYIDASGYKKTNGNKILLTTGSTRRNTALNIHNLASNVFEWTLEYSGEINNKCTQRGGYFLTSGSMNVTTRQATTDIKNYNGIGFRVALY